MTKKELLDNAQALKEEWCAKLVTDPQMVKMMTELQERQVVGGDWDTQGLVGVDSDYRRVVD